MQRIAMVLSLAAFTLFNYGQYRGWNLFSDDAQAQTMRSANAARAFHK
ncbi:MAG: hypothetical protein U1A72_08940 [Sulfuritalea sp.]|nr:hypothetical protein [Sulfuritalea sp.]